MKKVHCTLCLGSNTEAEKNIEMAYRFLNKSLHNINWEKARWTEPVDFPNPAKFLNQKGEFYTTKEMAEIKLIFKNIERECGRLPEDKSQGIVRMDIDLISYGEMKLKELVF